jgi:hypothetical protein
MLGAGVPVLDTDQRGVKHRLDRTVEPSRFIVLEPSSWNPCS